MRNGGQLKVSLPLPVAPPSMLGVPASGFSLVQGQANSDDSALAAYVALRHAVEGEAARRAGGLRYGFFDSSHAQRAEVSAEVAEVRSGGAALNDAAALFASLPDVDRRIRDLLEMPPSPAFISLWDAWRSRTRTWAEILLESLLMAWAARAAAIPADALVASAERAAAPAGAAARGDADEELELTKEELRALLRGQFPARIDDDAELRKRLFGRALTFIAGARPSDGEWFGSVVTDIQAAGEARGGGRPREDGDGVGRGMAREGDERVWGEVARMSPLPDSLAGPRRRLIEWLRFAAAVRGEAADSAPTPEVVWQPSVSPRPSAGPRPETSPKPRAAPSPEARPRQKAATRPGVARRGGAGPGSEARSEALGPRVRSGTKWAEIASPADLEETTPEMVQRWANGETYFTMAWRMREKFPIYGWKRVVPSQRRDHDRNTIAFRWDGKERKFRIADSGGGNALPALVALERSGAVFVNPEVLAAAKERFKALTLRRRNPVHSFDDLGRLTAEKLNGLAAGRGEMLLSGRPRNGGAITEFMARDIRSEVPHDFFRFPAARGADGRWYIQTGAGGNKSLKAALAIKESGAAIVPDDVIRALRRMAGKGRPKTKNRVTSIGGMAAITLDELRLLANGRARFALAYYHRGDDAIGAWQAAPVGKRFHHRYQVIELERTEKGRWRIAGSRGKSPGPGIAALKKSGAVDVPKDLLKRVAARTKGGGKK